MSKIYIFGNSFTLNNVEEYSWIHQLTKKYSVKNFSRAGETNGAIFLNFLKNVNAITEEDIVIICWSDYYRFYVKDPSILNKKKTLEKAYYDHFHDETLLKYHSHGYLDQIKQIVKDKNIRMIFFWAIPTEFLDMPNWVSTKFDPTSSSSFVYSHEFENEVRPALIYFSRKELGSEVSLDENKIVEMYQHDPRPNHISDKNVHKELFTIIEEFFQGKISGSINLEDRLNNGS